MSHTALSSAHSLQCYSPTHLHCLPIHLCECPTQHYHLHTAGGVICPHIYIVYLYISVNVLHSTIICTKITALFDHTFPLLTYTSECKCYTAILSAHNYSIIQPHISTADLHIWMKVLHSTIVHAITASFNHTFALFTHKHYELLPSGWWFVYLNWIQSISAINSISEQINPFKCQSSVCTRACVSV